jgi:hypothetical protein
MTPEKYFSDLRTALNYLEKLEAKYNAIVKFLDSALAVCDGCGKPDFKDSMKTISAPFGGDTIYICLDCWNEFLKES